MIQSKSIPGELDRSNQTSANAAALEFSPERALAGIAFHLIDEGITKFITNDSIERTLNRLRHESFLLTISPRTWATMTNSARLRRLLEETATEAALLPDDTVILAHRARRSR